MVWGKVGLNGPICLRVPGPRRRCAGWADLYTARGQSKIGGVFTYGLVAVHFWQNLHTARGQSKLGKIYIRLGFSASLGKPYSRLGNGAIQ